jgi:hypothetical protein
MQMIFSFAVIIVNAFDVYAAVRRLNWRLIDATDRVSQTPAG